ncbi:MAG TPA: peptide ABC transporter substrate-binding protein, partial [Thermoleptolyngbya sp. M55_K2018_002]|nr:peptide ABC transporter substrate-binding protein [Thermoleptolyngbya sp. M55_K2018_002]
MAKECLSNSAESQVPAAPPETPKREPVKIMVVGSRWAVLLIIHT